MADTQRAGSLPQDSIVAGAIISHRYELVEAIGCGAYGDVWRAADHLNPYRPVAIKLLRSDVVQADAQRRFQDECDALELLLQSNHIVKILGRGSFAGRGYVVTEYVEGVTLSKWIHDVSPRSPVSWSDAFALFSQICGAVAAAHCLTVPGPIVHCDLKPDNIIVREEKGKLHATLLDFGVAQMGMPMQSQGSGNTPGTPAYMAPEQAIGDRGAIGPWTDVFALGVLLVEVLTAQPYAPTGEYMRTVDDRAYRELPNSWRRLRPDIDERLWPVLLRAVSSRQSDRYPDAGALLFAIQSVLLPMRSISVLPHMPPMGRAFHPRLEKAWRWVVCLMALLQISDGAAVSASSSLAQPAVPLDMVFIQGGQLIIGSTVEQVDRVYAECLSEQAACRANPTCTGNNEPACVRDIFNRQLGNQPVELSSFYIDRTEVSNAQYVEWMNSLGAINGRLFVTDDRWVWYEGDVQLLELGGRDGGIGYKDGRFFVLPGRAQLPVVQLTWDGAERYCASFGKTLPSEAQWEWATRGSQERPYPWGYSFTATDCSWIALARAPGLLCGHLTGLNPVGQSSGDRTPEGVLDLGGNAMEWTRDRFRKTYASASNRNPIATLDSQTDIRVVRGGSFSGMVVFARGRDRSRWERARGANNIGFRCTLDNP